MVNDIVNLMSVAENNNIVKPPHNLINLEMEVMSMRAKRAEIFWHFVGNEYLL